MQKRCSFSTMYKTTNKDEPITDDLPALVRNKINLNIFNELNEAVFLIELSNVNEYNLQPCRFRILSVKNKSYTKKASCLIDRSHVNISKLDSITYCDPIDILSITDLNIPELEIKPSLRNKEWC